MDVIPVHQIINATPVTDNRLGRTRIAPTADPLPQPVQHYWNYRQQLALEDGLLVDAHCLVIPTSQRAEYLKDLHTGHLGEEKTLLRARKTVFWPGISDDMRNELKACHICQKNKSAQSRNRSCRTTYLVCHGSSSELTNSNTVPITTY